MSARLVTLALALGSIALGSGSTSSAQQTPTRPVGSSCRPVGAHTLATNAKLRVYTLRGVVYGCEKRSGKRLALGQAGFCLGTGRVGPVAVAADLVAYGVETCGIDTGSSEILVRRLPDGKRLMAKPAITKLLGPESYDSVYSIVLKADGTVAWIAAGSSIVRHNEQIEVHSASAHRERLLDTGAGIATRSLHLRGSCLSWKHGHTVRTTKL